jgi:GH25 family lysozyme M1 (1,4-beta-N-acetylmuramidase)
MYPVIDLEKNEVNGDPFNAERFFKQAKELIDRLVDKYNDCIIYTGAFFFEQYKDKYPWLLDYPLWVADYGYQKGNNTLVNPRIKTNKEGKRNWAIWQKTDKHSDKEIYENNLDFNVLNGEVLNELIMIQKPFETFVDRQKKLKQELLEIIEKLRDLSLREEFSEDE